jgi:threonine/homoserine/homoserine lactone efflux protein
LNPMQPETSGLLTLLSVGLVQLLAVISPGPSFLITARTAVAQSRVDGVKVALGLGTGTVLWAVAALLGLNVLFRTLPPLFIAMKILGALFLLWIAFQIFRHAADPITLDGPKRETVANPFVKGFLTQISNPKVAVFFGSIFIAMLPADVPLWMTLALVAIVSFNEVWWYSVVALFFGSGRVRRFYIDAKKWIDRTTGLFLGALGVRLLWAAREIA